MTWPSLPTWDVNGGNSWDSDPLKTWDDFFTDSINADILPNIEFEIWAGFSNDNILIGKFNVDSISLNSVDRTVKFSGRDNAKALISNQISTNLFKNIKNELAIEYLANLLNISSSLMDLNVTAGVLNYFYPQDQQAWETSQKIGEAVGLSSLYFDVNGVFKMNTVTESEGILNLLNNIAGDYYLEGGDSVREIGSIPQKTYLWFFYSNIVAGNLNIIKYDLDTQSFTVITVITTSSVGSLGNYGFNLLSVLGNYYFAAYDGLGPTNSLFRWTGAGVATNVAPDFATPPLSDYGDTKIWGISASGTLIEYDAASSTHTDHGHPVSGGNNYTIIDIFYDTGSTSIIVTAYYLSDVKMFVYTGIIPPLFVELFTFPVGVAWHLKSADCGIAGVYLFYYSNGVSYVYKTTLSITTLLSVETSEILNFTNLPRLNMLYLNGNIYFANRPSGASSAMCQQYYYNIASNTFSLIGQIYSDYITRAFIHQGMLCYTLAYSCNVYFYKPAPVVSTTPVFTFSYDGTLISLQIALTDTLGGDNSILNDIEVKSQTQSLKAAAIVYTEQSVPIFIPAGVSLTLYPELTANCDTTLVLNVTWSAPGTGETAVITQHPFKPTVILTAGGTDQSVTVLTITGEEIQNIGTLRSEVVDTPAKLFLYGKRKYSLQNDYITGANMPQIIASGLLAKYKDPTSLIESMDVAYCPNVEIEDVVLVTELNSNISRNYIVIGITHAIAEAVATTKLKLIKA